VSFSPPKKFAKRPSVVVSRIQKTFLALRTPDRAKGHRPLESTTHVQVNLLSIISINVPSLFIN